jgi:hypothetical protein
MHSTFIHVRRKVIKQLARKQPVHTPYTKVKVNLSVKTVPPKCTTYVAHLPEDLLACSTKTSSLGQGWYGECFAYKYREIYICLKKNGF